MSSWHRPAVLLLLAAFLLSCVQGLLRDSPTVDEFAHLPAGYYYLKTGNFYHYSLNPPLVKLISALPLLGLQPRIDTAARIEHTGWYPWVFATDFLERNRGNYEGIFLFGRLPVVLLGLLLGLLVYRWARELYGADGALLALAFYALCPSIAAHAHLATVDVGAALFAVLALYAFDRYLRQPGPASLALAGLGLGLALLAKFTALLLLPVLALLTLWGLARREIGWKAVAGGAALCGLSLLVIDLGYLFQGVGTPLGELRLQSRSLAGLARSFPGLPSPLPGPFLQGIDGLQLINEQGEYPGYLFGQWSQAGWALYYPIAILFKTPLPFLLAGLLAPWIGSRRREERAVWFPLLALLAAFSLLSRIDYGIRYVLPVLPLLAVYAGRLAPWLRTARKPVRTAAAALLLTLPVTSLLAAADTIGYFNLLAGGRGERILLDSNLDWGQGLKRLKTWMDREGVEEIGLAYFGHVDPALYGIRWHLPEPLSTSGRPGPVAVSLNFLHGYPYATYFQGRIVPVPADAFTWLARHPRVAEPGGGIVVVQVP